MRHFVISYFCRSCNCLQFKQIENVVQFEWPTVKYLGLLYIRKSTLQWVLPPKIYMTKFRYFQTFKQNDILTNLKVG